jgi:hypothetical protein
MTATPNVGVVIWGIVWVIVVVAILTLAVRWAVRPRHKKRLLLDSCGVRVRAA